MDPENDFIESERAGQSAHTTMSDSPYELLLIEDNPRDVELFREYLDGATAANQMEHYPSLADAKTVLNSDSFDLIILDLDLEDSRGLDTFEAIRETAPETPIIILTGHKDHKLGKTAIEQGAQDYLFKQEINTHWLNKAINYAIERYDVTQELQRANKDLKEEKEYSENIIRSFLDTLIVTDAEGKIQQINQVTLELLGYERDDLLGEPFGTILEEEGMIQLFTGDLEGFHQQGEIRNRELDYRTKNGELIPMSFNATVMKNERGEITGIVAGAKNISELKKTTERLENILATMGGMLIIFNKDGLIEQVNDALLTVLGYAKKDLIGHPVEILFDEQEEFLQFEQRSLQEIVERGELKDRELCLRTKQGESVAVLFSGRIMKQEGRGKETLVCVATDITERKRAQKKLRQAEKLSALGKMSAGMMHEINNPNTFISGNIQYVSKALSTIEENVELKKEHEEILSQVYEALDEMDRGSQRIEEIVNNVKQFARKGTTSNDYEKVSPDTVLKQAVENCAEILTDDINFTFTIKIDSEQVDQRIECDRNELQQVIINLISNAVDAVEELDLKQSPEIHCLLEEEDDVFIYRVRDNGPGIPSRIRDKIFDPFFTTKKTGEGTGLGLSIVNGITERLGAELEFDSETGKGTEFRFKIPKA